MSNSDIYIHTSASMYIRMTPILHNILCLLLHLHIFNTRLVVDLFIRENREISEENLVIAKEFSFASDQVRLMSAGKRPGADLSLHSPPSLLSLSMCVCVCVCVCVF